MKSKKAFSAISGIIIIALIIGALTYFNSKGGIPDKDLAIQEAQDQLSNAGELVSDTATSAVDKVGEVINNKSPLSPNTNLGLIIIIGMLMWWWSRR